MRHAADTEVLVVRGLPDDILPGAAERDRAFIVTQPGASHVAARVSQILANNGLKTRVHLQPDREEGKSLPALTMLWDALAEFGLLRSDVIVTVGGGSVSDVGGFAAATWMRGVEVVHVPTTLLGAVDAALGGKSGINLAGKNMVGAFWPPSRVVIDVDELTRLPSQLIVEGMAECVKAGLVGDSRLVAILEESGLDADLEEVIRRTVAVKMAIVAADERENSIRAILNFGHTIGHAVEYASTISHGEAVAIGMVAASAVSAEVVGFGGYSRVKAVIGALTLPTAAPTLDRGIVLRLLGRDKKRDAGGIRMVLLESIGSPVIRHVGESEIRSGLSAIGL